MGQMICGAETTREEEVIYNPDTQADIEKTLELLGLGGSKKATYILEDLVWSVVRREECLD